MCGKRLKAWKTMPMRRRIRLTSTPARGDLVAFDDDPAGVDRLQQVDAAQQRRLARARRPDEADDLVLRDGEVDAAQDLDGAERLVQALDPERFADRPSGAARRGALAAIAGDEPVGEPGERDRHDDEDQGDGDVAA